MRLSYCRKLLQEAPIIQPSKSNASSSSSSTADNDREPVQPQFDSSMALTLFAILITLFVLGFLSMYLGRRNSANRTAVARQRRRRYSFYFQEDFKGLSPRTVRSLPLVCYGGDAEQGIIKGECVVCLSEFEEKEMVKMIPFCRHVFHPMCIDTWLYSHVSCPLCRSATIFAPGVSVEG